MTDKERLEYSKYLHKIAMIENSITVICFTLLAIVFKNFWIFFISVFFLTSVE